MTAREMMNIVDGRVLMGEEGLDRDIQTAFCSDLMSDVLAFVNEETVLITGLVNPHVVRTSEMLDLKCILFVRGKQPSQDILDAAEDMGMTVLSTRHTAFTVCGMLYAAGLRGIQIEWKSAGEG